MAEGRCGVRRAPRRCSTPARMEAALASLPGVTRDEAGHRALGRSRRSTRTHRQRWSRSQTTSTSTTFASAKAERLTTEAGEEEVATFSPDGRLVAFVRGNNLFVVDVASQRERALTTDGSRELFNGKLDWLYQEEIYGRGQFQGYWWSPDSSRARVPAARRAAGSRVHASSITFPIGRHSKSPTIPKPAIPNPLVKLGRRARRGRRPVVGRPARIRGQRVPDRQRRIGLPIRAGRSSGAGSRADLARPESGRRVERPRSTRCCARRRRRG